MTANVDTASNQDYVPSLPDTTRPTNSSCEGRTNLCVGDVTHWDGGNFASNLPVICPFTYTPAGLGACGSVVDTNTDMAIALPHGFMGERSNDNPYCNREVTIRNPMTSQEFQTRVKDKCMGCEGGSIDLTNTLFDFVVPNGDGRVHGIEWWLS